MTKKSRERPDEPVARPRHGAQRQQAEEGRDRDLPVSRSEERIRDAPAVELADREEVERRDEEPDPAREGHRVDEDVVPGRQRSEDEPRHEAHEQRVAERHASARRDGRHLRPAEPIQSAGSATTSPASGPAAAMSKSEFLSRAGERMRMMAPSVPKSSGGGAGMKYGRLTEAP